MKKNSSCVDEVLPKILPLCDRRGLFRHGGVHVRHRLGQISRGVRKRGVPAREPFQRGGAGRRGVARGRMGRGFKGGGARVRGGVVDKGEGAVLGGKDRFGAAGGST